MSWDASLRLADVAIKYVLFPPAGEAHDVFRYEVPAIVRLSVESVNQSFADWVVSETD